MIELVVLSGKGGTGKTSVTASLAALAENPLLADCDVDASNLPLVLDPMQRQSGPFTSGLRARIDASLCTACGKCVELCRFDAISHREPAGDHAVHTMLVDPPACEGCGVCAHFCPQKAIEMNPAEGGAWLISETRFGPLVHARLIPGHGNSGRLVTLVREKARTLARETGRRLILIDGPPGIGCPVMASLTGVTHLLAVTEPTPSGEHDLQRILSLARHFEVPAWVCVNKHDLNPEMTARMEGRAVECGAALAGRIPYDPAVTAAQRQGCPVVEFDPGNPGPAAQAMIQLWKKISDLINPISDPSRSISAR